jgi:hypothetical protein
LIVDENSTLSIVPSWIEARSEARTTLEFVVDEEEKNERSSRGGLKPKSFKGPDKENKVVQLETGFEN